MKRTTGILVCTLAAGMAWAQSPEIIQSTRTKLNTVQQNKTAASNEALGIKQPPAKDSQTKSTATPVKSSAAVAKTSVTPAKASVAPAKASVAPAKASVTPAKATVVPAKTNATSPKPKVVAAPATSKPAVPFAPKKAASASPTPKVTVKPIPAKKEGKPAAAHKTVAAASSTTSAAAKADQYEEKASDDDAVKETQDKKWSMSGKRDPFISPVVSHTGGSGCSTGKKCLEIGAINLRGVVHSDAGFIAVVTNSLNKAYFLRENDPVFNGYVVKITGDSVIFKETMQDRLGKSFTREVVKKLTTPAV
jgi:hypothetical protein